MDWTNNYSLGVLEIDDEHKKLLQLISNVESAIDASAGPTTVRFAIVELKRFAKVHFKSEEEMMRVSAYKHLPNHQNEHSYFIKKLEEIEQRTLSRYQGRNEMLNDLHNWFTTHLFGADREYADHVRETRKDR